MSTATILDTATTTEKLDTAAILSSLGPIIGLVVVFALFAILRPKTFLTLDNIQIMLLQTAVVGSAALGMTMIIISGGIDLSIGSNVALCTVVIVLMLSSGVPPLFAAIGGILCGSLCGLGIGLLITRLSLTPFIVTLGMWGALRGLAKGLSGETMVSAPSTWLNNLLQSLGPGSKWMIFPPGVWLLIILTILVGAMLRYTRFGRHIYAIGSNEQTARLCGISVKRTKLLIYVFGLGLCRNGGSVAVFLPDRWRSNDCKWPRTRRDRRGGHWRCEP